MMDGLTIAVWEYPEAVAAAVKTLPALTSHKIKVFGRECTQHRKVGFFSNTSTGYKYSGSTAISIPLTAELTELLGIVNEKFSAEFNGILVNVYESGHDYISKHSDDERGLDPTAGIVALSYGVSRKFRIRGSDACDFDTNDREYIQMSAEFNRNHTHEIPPQKRITGTRWSFTFRRHTE